MKAKPNVIKNTLWYGTANFFLKSAGFLLLPVYSHFISPQHFGDYSLIVAVYAILAALTQAGMQSSYTKFYLEKQGAEKLLTSGTGFSFVLLITTPFVVFSVFLPETLSHFITGNTSYRNAIILYGFITLFDSFGNMYLQHLKTVENVKEVIALTGISSMVNIIVGFVLVYFFRSGVEGIIIAQLVASCIVPLFRLKEIYGLMSAGFNKNVLREMLIFAVPLYIAGIFTTVTDVADRFLLNFFKGSEDVGVYSFAYRVAMVMNLFAIAFRTAWTPASIKSFHSGEYKIHFGRIFTKLIYLASLLLISVTVFLPLFSTLQIFNTYIINPQYLAGLAIIPVIMLAYLCNALISFYSVYPYISGKSSLFLYSDFINLSVNLIANIILIPRFALTGAAIATLLGYFSSVIFMYLVSYKEVEVEYEKGKLLLIFTLLVGFLTLRVIPGNSIFDVAFLIIAILLGFGMFGSSVFRLHLFINNK